MHDDCIFCKIVRGELPSHRIYEDEHTLAFLNIAPIREGHTLIIPKEHYTNIEDVPDDLYTHLMLVSKRIKIELKDLYNAPYSGLFTSGVDVAHTHIHVLPMWDSGDITSNAKVTPPPTQEVLAQVAEKIRKVL